MKRARSRYQESSSTAGAPAAAISFRLAKSTWIGMSVVMRFSAGTPAGSGASAGNATAFAAAAFVTAAVDGAIFGVGVLAALGFGSALAFGFTRPLGHSRCRRSRTAVRSAISTGTPLRETRSSHHDTS